MTAQTLRDAAARIQHDVESGQQCGDPIFLLAVADWLKAAAALSTDHAKVVQDCLHAEDAGGQCSCSMKDCYECGRWHNCHHSAPRTTDATAVAHAYLNTT